MKIDNAYSDIKAAKKQCVEEGGGYLPRLASNEDFELITAFANLANPNPIWTSLTTDTSP